PFFPSLGKDTVPSKRIGWQADPAWEGRGRRDRACPCPRLYGIELFPVNGKAFDPPLQQFLTLAVLEPFVDGCLQTFIGAQEGHCLFMSFHLSPIPVAFLLWLLEISAQLLLEFCEGVDL